MMQNWFLVQVSTDMFYHMADDIRYLGQTTFRGSRSYEEPCEDDFLVVYSGFNSGSLFPLFVSKVSKVLIKPKSVIRISLCRTAKRNPLIFPI